MRVVRYNQDLDDREEKDKITFKKGLGENQVSSRIEPLSNGKFDVECLTSEIVEKKQVDTWQKAIELADKWLKAY